MKKYRKERIIIVTLLFTVLCVCIGSILSPSTHAEALIAEQCLGYEQSGNIPQGSCACSEQLYDTWSESYNWMDACEILEAKKE